MRPEGLSMKNSSDTIGNRTRDIPVCSAVPQPLRHRVPRSVSTMDKRCRDLKLIAETPWSYPPREATRSSDNKEILRILWNPITYCHVYKSSPVVLILSHINLVHNLPTFYWRIFQTVCCYVLFPHENFVCLCSSSSRTSNAAQIILLDFIILRMFSGGLRWPYGLKRRSAVA
jgi:hypothetical protein